ncbi:hypothetical protein L6164_027253 [Bauhinia variegata]|uniref:Uncharacterized protein n=1 Tax=Bauhinia variegata TaxID=167791 RepID=A0ACB9LST5_BAUVA|nr:hypothetical protein L6164_027253 [Bauhinia variegata]
MPWLAAPFADSRKSPLSRKFKVHGIPMAVAIGPSGNTVTKEARNLLMLHGAEAHPFTDERIQEIEAKYEEIAKGWSEKLARASHELVLTRRWIYNCDGCDEEGNIWSYYCDECD